MTVIVGDCVEGMRELEPCSVDAVVCDPPYGLEFMGKDWDSLREFSGGGNEGKVAGTGINRNSPRWGGQDGREQQEWHRRWAAEALRVLKPGGHLLAFGGTRTYHRLAVGIEDAGFEIRDCLCWMYGSGFPKSLNLDGEWEGWGTALKPAYEPIVLARKPLTGTVGGNVLAHGTGALNIDGCRIDGVVQAGAGSLHTFHGGDDGYELGTGREYQNLGRWPANVVLDEHAATLLDQQTGELTSGALRPYTERHENASSYRMEREKTYSSDANSGGASRFYYVAKASRAERNAGLDGFEEQAWRGNYGVGIQDARPHTREGYEYHAKTRNTHPTVKPVALMRWLIRLITPPGGLILDPFTGSGTTGIAAHLEGLNFLGFERDPDYAKIAQARIAYWLEHGHDTLRIVAEQEQAERARAELEAAGQLTLEGTA